MPESFEERKEQYKPELTSLTDIYRNPLHEPLATIAATLILSTLTYQAYVIASNSHPVMGVLALLAGYSAYRLAKIGWAIQNDHIATVLSKRDLEDSNHSNR